MVLIHLDQEPMIRLQIESVSKQLNYKLITSIVSLSSQRNAN